MLLPPQKGYSHLGYYERCDQISNHNGKTYRLMFVLVNGICLR